MMGIESSLHDFFVYYGTCYPLLYELFPLSKIISLSMTQNISLKKFRSDYRISDFQIPKTKLGFQIFEGYTIVQSELHIVRTNTEATELVLDGEKLELISCVINGQEVDKTTLKITEHSLCIPWLYEDACTLQIQNKIYPEQNTLLE